MIKQFTPWQLFSLVDGRLSTESGDLYDMLCHICDEPGLMTHHLPTAWSYLKEKNPKWVQEYRTKLDVIKAEHGNDFPVLRDIINKIWVAPIDVPQLKDEFDTSDFGGYMIDNSLLK
jgi:hypothetical protein